MADRIPESIRREALSHDFQPTIRIGKSGITETLITEIDAQLNTRSLVKIKINRGLFEKKDIPSGTAITLAESIVQNSSLNGWAMKGELGKLPIQSIRKKDLHGNHSITYESEIDKVTLSHSAFNRKGFALGAVIAAEKIFGKTGIHKFNSLLF